MTTYEQLTIQDAIIAQEIKKDVIVEIERDENAGNPREWDNAGIMACFHKRCNLGDTHNYDVNDFDSWDDFKNFLVKEKNAKIILPLNLYDHSGISMSIGDSHGWDNGQVGFIYLSKETIESEWGFKRITDKRRRFLEGILTGEVEEYNSYLTGNVYSYSITDKHTGDDLDSCGGFYGYDYLKQIKECAGLDTLYKTYHIIEKVS